MTTNEYRLEMTLTQEEENELASLEDEYNRRLEIAERALDDLWQLRHLIADSGPDIYLDFYLHDHSRLRICLPIKIGVPRQLHRTTDGQIFVTINENGAVSLNEIGNPRASIELIGVNRKVIGAKR